MTKTQAEYWHRLVNVLTGLGFTYDEANQLRRIEMTLRRWAELECGDGNDWASWAIERDEQTDKPYLVTYPHTGKSHRRPVADRERGALKRLERLLAGKTLTGYHQTDPRGCALYLMRPGDRSYTDGIAVCA